MNFLGKLFPTYLAFMIFHGTSCHRTCFAQPQQAAFTEGIDPGVESGAFSGKKQFEGGVDICMM